MTELDIDIDASAVTSRLQRLKERFSSEPAYVVSSNAEYSIYLEFGRGPVEAQSADALKFEDEDGNTIYRTSVSGHKPYPFFRPAVREYRADPEAFLLKNSELSSLDDVDSTEELVRSTAQALEAQMKKNATAGSPGRSPGTDPNHPKTQTGNLRARIVARRVK